MLFAVVGGLLMWSSAVGQEGDEAGSVAELKQSQQELKTELTAIKIELKKLSNDMSRLTAMFKALQAQQKAPAPGARAQKPAMTMVGKEAPKFDVTTIDGKELTIGGKRDKPQVLFCYASWCGYCRRSLPTIEELHKKYKDKDVEIVAVNLDARGEGGRTRSEEQTLKQYQDLKLTMPMTMTTGTNDTKKIGLAYKARSFPTLFVVGTSGQIESVHIGAKPNLDKVVGAEVDLLLQGKTRADFAKGG